MSEQHLELCAVNDNDRLIALSREIVDAIRELRQYRDARADAFFCLRGTVKIVKVDIGTF